MSFMGSMLSNDRGSGFQATGYGPQMPITAPQAEDARQNTLSALKQQQDFANAVNNPYWGIENSKNVFGQQQNLANQMNALASGTGPNPAMAQLNQTTGNNIQNQAALMAGQRGSSANPGLLARLAAQQGGNIQQQAVGQGATMAAQQQIAGMNALQGQQANMGNMANAQVGVQQGAVNSLNQGAQNYQQMLLNSIAQQNNANVSMQSNVNNTNAAIAGINAQGQQAMLGGAMQGLSGSSLLGGGGGKAHGGMIENYADGGMAGGMGSMMQALMAKFGGGGGSPQAASPVPQAEPPPNTSNGASFQNNIPWSEAMDAEHNPLNQMSSGPQANALAQGQAQQPQVQANGPQSNTGKIMTEAVSPQGINVGQTVIPADAGASALEKGFSSMAGSGIQKAVGSLIQSGTSMMGGGGGEGGGGGMGGMMALAALAKGGEAMVPGKAPVPGDSYANDKVAAKLSPGEIVIPRSITMGPNAPAMAAKFVAEELAKHNQGKTNFAEGGTAPPVEDLTPEEQVQKAKLDERLGQVKDLGQSFKNALFGSPQENYYLSTGRETPPQAPQPQVAPEVAQAPQALAQQGPAPQPQGGLDTVNKTAPDDPYGVNAYGDMSERGLRHELAGTYGEAKAEGDLGKAQAQYYQKAADNMQKLQATFQGHMDNINKERAALTSDINNQKIDPNRFVNNMGTTQKVMTGIGLIIGGMGGGLTRTGVNPAMNYLNQQIENDLKAQSMELGKKTNLLSSLHQQFGDMRDATDMFRVVQSDMISNQLKMEASKAADPMAKNRALVAAGQIESKYAPLASTIAMRRTLLNPQSGATVPPEAKIRALIPEAQQEHYYKELGEMENMVKIRDNALGVFDKVGQINTVGNRIMSPVQSGKQIDALIEPLIAQLSKETAGRFTEQDADMLRKLVKTGAFADDKTKAVARQRLNSLLSEKMNYPRLKTIGITPDQMSRFKGGGEKRIQLGPVAK